MKRSIVVPIAQNKTNQFTLTPPWFVQDSEYSVLPGRFELLTNGEEAFGAVYDAIENASKSVCIICWGFQPSMYFKRGNNPGLMIGELLEKKAIAGVKVRILSWAMELDIMPGPMEGKFSVAGAAEVNTPGRRGSNVGFWGRSATLSNREYRYDIEWYGRYDGDQSLLADTLPRKVAGIDTKARTENLVFAGRGFSGVDRGKILTSSRADGHTSATTRLVQAGATSHHQKMVLVDFEDPQRAVGFVMGHNMLDEYWDRSNHSYRRDPNPRTGRNGSRPREDFSSRISGPMLGDLFHNFNTAWKGETGEDLTKGMGMPLFERYPLSGISREKEKEAQQKQIAKLREQIDRERALQDVVKFDFSEMGKRQIAESKARQRDLEAERLELEKRLAAPRANAADIAEDGTAVMGQILRTQPQYGVRDIAKCYLQAVNNAAQCIYIENQYFRWPVLAEKIKACADGQSAWNRRPEVYGPIHLFVITNASKEGMGPGTENTGRMLESLGRANQLPGVTRQQAAEDTEAELKRARLLEAQSRTRQSQALTAMGAARNSVDRKRADEELIAAQQQQKDAQARQTQLKQKLAEQKSETYAIVPEERPNLKVHICSLVAPDSPGRSGSFLGTKDGQGNQRGLTREERLARAKEELAKSEGEAARLRLLHRELANGQMYSPMSSYELQNASAANARLAAEKKQRDDVMQRCEAEEGRCKELRKEISDLADESNPIDWVDVYIHAKLMIVDDTFMTLGSTNINSRSMETDSELNVAHANPLISQPARKKLWALHTNGRSGGEPFTPKGMKDAYEMWGQVMKDNKDARRLHKPPMASLVEFYSGTTKRTNND